MTDDVEHPHAELITVRTSEEALVIAALLREAGIPVYVGGRMLQDEFAVAQKMLNLQTATLAVPEDRIAEAKELIALAKEDGRALSEEADAGDGGGDGDG